MSISIVHAHQMRPAIVSISFDQQAVVKVQIETNVEAILSGIGAEHENTDDAPQAEVYRELRELSADDLKQKFNLYAEAFSHALKLQLSGQEVDWQFKNILVPEVGDIRLSRKSVIEYTAAIPQGAAIAVWSFDQKYGDAVVNFISAGQTEKTTYWLAKGQQSPEYELHKNVIPRSWIDVAVDYSGLGFIHILPKGLDHILFVLGLFLLSRNFRPLLWQVTAFTMAHTITLALSIYGLISVSSLIVEPLIALSIAYVGIENLLTRELKPWRVIIVFIFGLLHGMGFAGVLTELGLPESQFVNALLSFNVGVELGQLSVILLAFLAVFWLRKNQGLYRKLVVIPGSLGISLMGLYWTVERVGYL
ncbi:MAG: HupE/UreJ family protein [Gammaproteobacteria bacterium]|nr:HupE/UreJ family protein [Gammaproteobacteria bacterium]MBT3725632.1 HupE/UreJ family protein [Gammaproteobacteria bacterium]MBT4078436.1 HupE/UreJ family protein [Gammaproteobacteria bacterium]MBT4195659.1 HupE/UreJ family protein [Gammaproteobacteria bacterium]MBT4449201.1 HupE/UreJ family protein [Gammaproteobacteria bacterium]